MTQNLKLLRLLFPCFRWVIEGGSNGPLRKKIPTRFLRDPSDMPTTHSSNNTMSPGLTKAPRHQQHSGSSGNGGGGGNSSGGQPHFPSNAYAGSSQGLGAYSGSPGNGQSANDQQQQQRMPTSGSRQRLQGAIDAAQMLSSQSQHPSPTQVATGQQQQQQQQQQSQSQSQQRGQLSSSTRTGRKDHVPSGGPGGGILHSQSHSRPTSSTGSRIRARSASPLVNIVRNGLQSREGSKLNIVGLVPESMIPSSGTT